MKTAPYVGQKVRLNSEGYHNLGLRSAEAFEQSKRMTITSVENINAGTPNPPIWAIEVDQPLIDMYVLDYSMVEPLEGVSGSVEVLS